MTRYRDLVVPDEVFSKTDIVGFGDICEGMLLDESGKLNVEQLGAVPRKTLCQFEGVGDSTVTGWLQAGRMPRAAALAYVLYWNVKHRVAEIEHLKRKLLDPRVLHISGKVEGEYAVFGFRERSDGELEGFKLAGDVTHFGDALYIARSRSSDFRERQMSARDQLELANHPEIEDVVGPIIASIDDDLMMESDYSTWAEYKKERDALPEVSEFGSAATEEKGKA